MLSNIIIFIIVIICIIAIFNIIFPQTPEQRRDSTNSQIKARFVELEPSFRNALIEHGNITQLKQFSKLAAMIKKFNSDDDDDIDIINLEYETIAIKFARSLERNDIRLFNTFDLENFFTAPFCTSDAIVFPYRPNLTIPNTLPQSLHTQTVDISIRTRV